jgi:hypothetical protein
MTEFKATDLYKALASVGLKRSQVRAILPDWWDDETATTEAGFWELAMVLARRFSLDVGELAKGIVKPTGAVRSVAFKHRATQKAEALKPTSLIASSLAQAVLAAMPPAEPAQLSAGKLRGNILRDSAAVGFDELLQFCWSSGIPVIPLPHLPVGLRKMDGAALSVGDRPVIILPRKQDSRAWMSFILAHELGHVCSGHLQPNAAIVDVALKNNSTYQTESAEDPQEREADQFALDLLGGAEAAAAIAPWSERASSVDLAVLAREASQAARSTAGHLVLRHAFHTKRWPESISALQFLDEDFDAQAAMVSSLRSAVDLDLIAEDLRDLVSKIVGIPA